RIIAARLFVGYLVSNSGEDWIAQLLAPSARYFVDVGANLGTWTLMFAGYMSTSPAGLLFEPNPDTAVRLRSVLLDKDNLQGCEIIEAAVSDREGSAQFYVEQAYGATSGFYLSHARANASTVSVKVCRLDTELAKRNIANVDVLKIDAEGH